MLLMCVAPGLGAHHSRGHFDRTRSMEMKAVITKVGWVNPHVFLLGQVRTADGQMQEWTFECHTINGQMRHGWTKDTVKVGDALTLIVNPHRDAGRHLALVDQVVLADGRRLTVAGSFPPN
jgi:hypothetical protein